MTGKENEKEVLQRAVNGWTRKRCPKIRCQWQKKKKIESSYNILLITEKKTPKHALNGQKRDKISYNVISMARQEKEKVLLHRAPNDWKTKRKKLLQHSLNGWKGKRKRALTTFCMWLEIKNEKNPTTCSHWLENKTKRVTKTRCQ